MYFVVLPHAMMLDVVGPSDALASANRSSARTIFRLHFVGPASRVVGSSQLIVSELDPLPHGLPENAIVVLTGVSGERLDPTLPTTRAVIDWLRSLPPGYRLVCICTGSLVAAHAGLLDGRVCTTHYTECDELRRVAPRADVRENRIFTEDGSVFTSAGVTAGIDLTLHLIAELVDPRCAAQVARRMVVYLRRGGSDPQLSPWLDGRNHLHPAIHRVQDALSGDPARDWDLSALAAIAGISQRHLARLFQEHVGTNVVDYLHRLRVGLAHELLTQTELDMERVAERAGFGSARHLRRVWKKFVPTPPRSA